MYKIYSFNIQPKNVFIIGDGHGNWGLLKYKIRECNIQNSIIIMAGDCGFGFEKREYYRQVYNKMLRVLSKQNVTLIFIRGNHDDPDYFNGDKVIDFKYFKTIPDYSILSFSSNGDIDDVEYNVLCVGGAISIDRMWRLKEESKYTNGRKLYWNDEIPVYRPDILNSINKDGIKINSLISHSSPHFAPLTSKNNIKNFIMFDSKLSDDIDSERMVMTQIYNHIIQDKHPLKLIIHGHFHEHSLFYSDDDVKIIMLDCMNTRNNSWDIYQLER